MSTFGDDLIRSLEEAVAHARGEGPAIVHASTPREVRKRASLTQAQMAPRRALAVMLVAMACSAVSSAQDLEVHLTHAEPGDPLRAGALYTATPINGWVYIDLALAPLISGDIRPHRDIYLVGHEGTRFALPDLRTYRANREAIREVFGAIAVSESAGVFPIARHFSVGCDEGGPVYCRRYALWRFTAGPVNRVITFNRSVVVQTELLFEAPAGGWAAGDYVLTIDGPGDSVTQLPVRIGW